MEGSIITIPLEEYAYLLEAADKLEYLHFYGVENWEGYSTAMEEYEKQGSIEEENVPE